MKTRLVLLLIAVLALVAVLAIVVTHQFPGQKAKVPNDLAVAEGKIISYSFLDDSRGPRLYTIRLSGYPATFQIPGDFAKFFAKARFESEVKKGDSVSVLISPASAGSLTSDGPVPIFAARTKTATYLDEYYTLHPRRYDDDNNAKNVADSGKHSPALTSFAIPLLTITFVSVLIGVAFIIWKSKNKPAPAPAPDGAFISESTQRLKQLAAKGKVEPKSTEAEPTENPQEPATAERT